MELKRHLGSPVPLFCWLMLGALFFLLQWPSLRSLLDFSKQLNAIDIWSNSIPRENMTLFVNISASLNSAVGQDVLNCFLVDSDAPVMTYFASYIVPIPGSASKRCCALCGAKGTSEELNAGRTFFISVFFIELLYCQNILMLLNVS